MVKENRLLNMIERNENKIVRNSLTALIGTLILGCALSLSFSDEAKGFKSYVKDIYNSATKLIYNEK